MNIGKKIQKLRIENSLSQEQLAEKCGISRQSVSKWESDQSVPDISNIIQLSEIFSVSTDYFLKDSDTTNATVSTGKKSIHPFNQYLTRVLSIGLLVSVIVSLMLWTDLRNTRKHTQSALNSIHNEYYVNLDSYNEILKTIVRQQSGSFEITSQVEKMMNHVDVLIHSSTQYIQLTESIKEPLGAYLWDMATSARWILREYFLEENEMEIKEEFRSIDGERISKVTEVIDEIIKLEVKTRTEMNETGGEYDAREMAVALNPKLKDLTELTILSFSQKSN